MGPAVILNPVFPRQSKTGELIPTAAVGMLIFLFTELMFFAGLISAFLVLKGQSPIWPPLDQPRLPVAATGANTAVLCASAVWLGLAWRARNRRRPATAKRYFILTLACGAVFLIVQGWEWVRLIGYGLTASSSLYGGTFYVLIGAHALHVCAALVFLAFASWQACAPGVGRRTETVLLTASMFWYFVVAIWPVLYALVYF